MLLVFIMCKLPNATCFKERLRATKVFATTGEVNRPLSNGNARECQQPPHVWPSRHGDSSDLKRDNFTQGPTFQGCCWTWQGTEDTADVSKLARRWNARSCSVGKCFHLVVEQGVGKGPLWSSVRRHASPPWVTDKDNTFRLSPCHIAVWHLPPQEREDGRVWQQQKASPRKPRQHVILAQAAPGLALGQDSDPSVPQNTMPHSN